MEFSSDGEFIKFKNRLGSMSAEEVRKQLKDRGEASKERLLEAFTESDRFERIQAVAEFALVSMAKEKALRSVKRGHNLDWITIARTDIMSFVEENPDERTILLGSIFFSQSWAAQEKLNDVIGSRIEPRGSYADSEFAAGVALGEITVNDRISGAFVKKYIPTEIS